MPEPLWTYLKLVSRKRVWGLVSLLATGLAMYNGLRKPTDPAVLPVWVWASVAVGSAMVAQFLVWRDCNREPPDPEHERQLRAIAESLRERVEAQTLPMYMVGNQGAPIHKEMFSAHFLPRFVRWKSCGASASASRMPTRLYSS